MKSFLRYFSLLISIGSLALWIVPDARAQTTVYQLSPEPLAQISGTPGARTLKPTFSATVTLNQNLGAVHQINGDSAVSATSTVTIGSAGQFGQLTLIICTASGAGTVTYTFDSTYFKSTGTAAPTTGKSITVAFVSDGTFWREFSRSVSAQ